MNKSTICFLVSAILFIVSCVLVTVFQINYTNGHAVIEIAGVVMIIPLIAGLFIKAKAEKKRWCGILAIVLVLATIFHVLIIIKLLT